MPTKKKSSKPENLEVLAQLINEFREEFREFRGEASKELSHHSKILNDHSKILNDHSEILAGHSEILNDHSEILNDHSKILADHSKKLDAHTVDIHDLKESVLGAIDGVKLSLDKLAPLEKIPERTATLEREVSAIKTAIKSISATKQSY